MTKTYILSCLCLAIFSSGCTIPSPQSKNNKTIPIAFIPHAVKNTKDPTVIALYDEGQNDVTRPYRILGHEKVALQNLIGGQRQSDTVDEMLRHEAATMGGDAIINITQDEHKIEGTVISYEKVLL